jgi:hypothetical protein
MMTRGKGFVTAVILPSNPEEYPLKILRLASGQLMMLSADGLNRIPKSVILEVKEPDGTLESPSA